MRVAEGLKVFAVGILLCAGCKEEDASEMFKDSGTPPADSGAAPADAGSDASQRDSGSGAADAGSPSDSGTVIVMDAGGGGSDSGSNVLTVSMGSWTVYDNPYTDGGANPAMGIQGAAMAVRAGDGGMTVTLNVSGLPAMRTFGSHVHKAECDAGMAGGHFQHMPAPDGGVTDPAFANSTNEVWLDFMTNASGAGMGSATVAWVPPPGGAKAIIVHDRMTGDGGIAGPKLACLPFPF